TPLFRSRAGVCRQRVGELVVPVQSRKFLDEINFALNIEPPRGNLNQIIGVLAWVDAKTKPHQGSLYFRVAEIFAQNALHFGTVKRDTLAWHRPGDQVNHIALQLTT